MSKVKKKKEKTSSNEIIRAKLDACVSQCISHGKFVSS